MKEEARSVQGGACGGKELKEGACGVNTHRLAWVQGLWSGLGFSVQGFGSRVQASGFRV